MLCAFLCTEKKGNGWIVWLGGSGVEEGVRVGGLAGGMGEVEMDGSVQLLGRKGMRGVGTAWVVGLLRASVEVVLLS